MQQVNNKVFEVDQIVCGRENKGCQEYLVYWKGFDLSSATWEPVENLLSCADVIEQFQRKVNPIPGANPFVLKRSEKTKTVHVKMLLTRGNKGKYKRSRCKSSAGLNGFLEVNDYNCNDEKYEALKTHDEKIIKPTGPKKRFNESEKLIRDTLVHESKTMVADKNSVTKLNGIYNDTSVKYNGTGHNPQVKRSLNRSFKGNDSPEEDLVLSTIRKGYMRLTLNNTKSHNVLTLSMLESLRDGLLKAMKNSEVKGVLLCNNGDHFCSGIDYSTLIKCCDDKEYELLVGELTCSIRSFLDVLLAFTKPLVCAVNGPTLEFGLALVVNSDFAYGSCKASFDMVYNKIHLTPIGCITQLLPKVAGNSMANSMLYIGGRYSAVLACERGLLLDMYGVNSFEEDIGKKMTQLTANSVSVLESTKKLVNHFEKSRLEEISKEELRVYEETLLTREVRRKLREDWAVAVNLYGDI